MGAVSEQGNHAREKTEEKPDLAAERPERARARFFAYTERTRRITNISKIDIATAYAISRGRRRNANGRWRTKSVASAIMGVRSRRRGNARTASWSDQSIGQPVRQYAYQERTYTTYDKAEEGKERHKKPYYRPCWS